ncbi:MAG: ABC transporter transmembrane domain-containing protein, partial [Chloroflexota bacterium]
MNFDRRLLAWAGRARLSLTIAVAAGLLGGALTVWQAFLMSAVVGAVFLRGAGPAAVQPTLLLLLGAIALRAALAGGRELAAQAAARRVLGELRTRLLGAVVARGPAYLAGERTGRLANLAGEGVDALEPYYAQFLPSLALAVLVPLAILVGVAVLDPFSALVFALTAPLIPLFTWLVGKWTETVAQQQWQNLSRLSAHFLDVVQGLPTLKLFGRGAEQGAALARVGERFRLATMSVLRVAFLSALSQELLATVSTAIVAVEVGLRLLYGNMEFERAFVVLLLAPEFYQPLRQLGASFHASAPGLAAAAEIAELLEGAEAPPRSGPLSLWERAGVRVPPAMEVLDKTGVTRRGGAPYPPAQGPAGPLPGNAHNPAAAAADGRVRSP